MVDTDAVAGGPLAVEGIVSGTKILSFPEVNAPGGLVPVSLASGELFVKEKMRLKGRLDH